MERKRVMVIGIDRMLEERRQYQQQIEHLMEVNRFLMREPAIGHTNYRGTPPLPMGGLAQSTGGGRTPQGTTGMAGANFSPSLGTRRTSPQGRTGSDNLSFPVVEQSLDTRGTSVGPSFSVPVEGPTQNTRSVETCNLCDYVDSDRIDTQAGEQRGYTFPDLDANILHTNQNQQDTNILDTNQNQQSVLNTNNQPSDEDVHNIHYE
ncbi:hypothetical protein P3S67_025667 [Capsicum chacoense]